MIFKDKIMTGQVIALAIGISFVGTILIILGCILFFETSLLIKLEVIVGSVLAIFMLSFLLYINCVITIYQIQFSDEEVIAGSLLKKYKLTGGIKIDYHSSIKYYIVYNNGKKLRFPKHYFGVPKSMCFSIMEMNKLLSKKL